jgi:hypothetical protein
MYICKVHAQCDARFSEIVPDNMKDVECMVEESVGQALIDLFGEGTVDDVSIYFAPYAYSKLKYYFIQVHAQCAYEDFILRPCTEEHAKEAIGRKVRAVLRELFLSAEVDTITLMPAPWDEGEPSLRYGLV